MFKLLDGLSLLMKDNDDRKRSVDERVNIWKDKSDDDVRGEIRLLAKAKALWFFLSVLGWNVVALTGLGLVANKIWEDDYKLTLVRLFIVLFSWASLLFVVWLVASMFDKHAGFERWQTAFSSRDTLDDFSIDDLKALEDCMSSEKASSYIEGVKGKRRLRREDMLIACELKRQDKVAVIRSELGVL